MDLHIDFCEDAGLLATLNRDVQDKHAELFPDRFKPFQFNAIRAEMRSFLETEGSVAFVALDADEPVGYALVVEQERKNNPYRVGYKYLTIDQMSVRPRYRRQGVATALIERIKELALQRDIARIELTVWSANREAVGFYDRLGFVCTTERRELDVGRQYDGRNSSRQS